MQRYLSVLGLLLLLPAVLSIQGCANKNSQYCNGAGYGYNKSQTVAITLQPQNTGLSVAYSQITQVQPPTATTCTGSAVTAGTFTYATTDQTIADISPTGQVCGGTWNINTPAVPNYTTCIPTYKQGVAYVTANLNGFSSNQVAVWSHPPITSLSVGLPTNQAGQPECISQGQTTQLEATAYCASTGATGACPSAAAAGQQSLICSPGTTACGGVIGNVLYTASNPEVVTINPANGVATAQAPGASLITGTLSSVAATAGYFYTCPPKSIVLTASGTGATSASVTPNTPFPLKATVTDVNNNVINGLALSYVSTNPASIGVNSLGSVTPTYSSNSAITAVCEPNTCNPAPINVIGTLGTGAPIVSNLVEITSPGQDSTWLYAASPSSPYFVPTDLTTGTTGNPVKLPYTPNSMILDEGGDTLYFGSYYELMVYSATTNTLTTQLPGLPGVVLAVSPTNSMVLVNDQLRGLFYIYAPPSSSTSTSGSATSTAGKILTTFAGVGQRAEFSPDGQTVFIVGNNTLYTYNTYMGWSAETLPASQAGPPTGTCPANNSSSFPVDANLYPPNSPSNPNNSYNFFCAPDLAITIPSSAAFLTGTASAAYGICPDTTVNPFVANPESTLVGVQTDHLAATTDGKHIVGATANPAELTDIYVNVPANSCPLGAGPNGVPQTTASTFSPTPTFTQSSLSAYGISNVNEVVASTNSEEVFVTYLSNATGPPPGGALLPVYKPSAQVGVPGTLSSVTLAGSAIAPIAGIFSPDNSTFFAATTGDNQVHLINTTTLIDTQQLNPKLVDSQNNPVPPVFLAVKPRPTT